MRINPYICISLRKKFSNDMDVVLRPVFFKHYKNDESLEMIND